MESLRTDQPIGVIHGNGPVVDRIMVGGGSWHVRKRKQRHNLNTAVDLQLS